MNNLLIAVLFGILFGFALHRVGASNPQMIINMLRLKDLHLMKVILLAIGVSSALLFLGAYSGIIDSSHFSVKSSYIGVLIGGLILGAGWAVSGYCPGTGIAAVGDGRKDAIAFVIGGLTGAFIYMLVFGKIQDSFLFKKIAGGNVSLAITGNEKYDALLETNGLVFAIILSVVFILIAWKLPKVANLK